MKNVEIILYDILPTNLSHYPSETLHTVIGRSRALSPTTPDCLRGRGWIVFAVIEPEAPTVRACSFVCERSGVSIDFNNRICMRPSGLQWGSSYSQSPQQKADKTMRGGRFYSKVMLLLPLTDDAQCLCVGGRTKG